MTGSSQVSTAEPKSSCQCFEQQRRPAIADGRWRGWWAWRWGFPSPRDAFKTADSI